MAGPQREAGVAPGRLLSPHERGRRQLLDVECPRGWAEVAPKRKLGGHFPVDRPDTEHEDIVIVGDLLNQCDIADAEVFGLQIRPPRTLVEVVDGRDGFPFRVLEGEDGRHDVHLPSSPLPRGQGEELDDFQAKMGRAGGDVVGIALNRHDTQGVDIPSRSFWGRGDVGDSLLADHEVGLL